MSVFCSGEQLPYRMGHQELKGYINEQNNSSDEEQEVEVFESPDYEPFMAKFWKYKPELTQVEKEDILTRGLINLRFNPHMRDIMVKMFGYTPMTI